MSYYFARTRPTAFEEAVYRVTVALQREGFGTITQIYVTETLKKLNVTFRNCRILGTCNPALTHEALQLEEKVGTMLPYNVIVQDAGNGKTEVAAIDPVASMQAISNERLKQAAEKVQAKLKRAIGTAESELLFRRQE